MTIIIKLKLIKYKKIEETNKQNNSYKREKNHLVKNLHLSLAGETCAS